MTGTLNPDATCNYHYAGTDLNGYDYFKRADGAYYLWYDGITDWNISVLYSIPGADYWTRTDPNLVGLYAPQGNATGNATVILGEHP